MRRVSNSPILDGFRARQSVTAILLMDFCADWEITGYEISRDFEDPAFVGRLGVVCGRVAYR